MVRPETFGPCYVHVTRYRGYFLGVKLPECVVHHSAPSSVQVEIECRCASTPQPCLHDMNGWSLPPYVYLIIRLLSNY